MAVLVGDRGPIIPPPVVGGGLPLRTETTRKDSPRPVDGPVATDKTAEKIADKVDDKKVVTKNGRCLRILKIVGIVAAAVVGVLALAALIAGIAAMIWPAFAAAVGGFVGVALSFVAAHALPFVIAGAVGLGVSAAVITGLGLSLAGKCDKDEKKGDEVIKVKGKEEQTDEETEIATTETPLSTGDQRGVLGHDVESRSTSDDEIGTGKE